MLVKMQQTIFGSFTGTWFEVRDVTQARLLTDPVARGLLTPFIGAECSATQAAQAVGCSVQRMLYRMRQFEQAGLLIETRQQRRSGRPIRFYRAVADGFHVPFEYTPFEDVEAMMARQYLPFDRLRDRVLARLVQQRTHVGRRIYRDAVSGEIQSESDQGLATRPLSMTTRKPGNDVTLKVRLTDEVAQRIAEELDDLYWRLEAARRPVGEGQEYLVHFGFLPLVAEDLDSLEHR